MLPVTQHPKVQLMAEGDTPGDKVPPDTLHIPPTMTIDLLVGLTKKEEVEVEEVVALVVGEEEEEETEGDLEEETEEELVVEAGDTEIHQEGHGHHLDTTHITPPPPPLLTLKMDTQETHEATLHGTTTEAWEGQVVVIYILAHIVIDLIVRTMLLHNKITLAYQTLLKNHGNGTGIFRFYPIF